MYILLNGTLNMKLHSKSEFIADWKSMIAGYIKVDSKI